MEEGLTIVNEPLLVGNSVNAGSESTLPALRVWPILISVRDNRLKVTIKVTRIRLAY